MANGNHPLSGLMDSSMQNLRKLVDADTIIGEAITTPDGIIIIPISKVSFGFGAGGSDLPVNKQGELFGGGAGGGVSVQPLGFLVIKDGNVELLHMHEERSTAEVMVNMVPDVVGKLGVMFKKEKKDKTDGSSAPENSVETKVE